MCDVQLVRHENGFLFAKNSDREASEAQLVRRFAGTDGDKVATVQTTYLSIPQTARRHAVVLSQPGWIWGAEMGANERGVVIGNTAVFSRLATHEKGLIGMDLLRLALERGDNAAHAMQVIIELLQVYGQGGPCGYRNKGFKYDNAFLIADGDDAWQLETAGRHWVAKKVQDKAAISNCMAIGKEFDRSSQGIEDAARVLGTIKPGEEFDFAKAFETQVMPIVSGARMRRSLSQRCMTNQAEANLAGLARNLRTHNGVVRAEIRHNHDVCMHAGGATRPSQSTGAMLADVRTDGLDMLFTGTSATCMSIFRPVKFDGYAWSVLSEVDKQGSLDDLWHRHESIQRRLSLGMLDADAFTGQRDALEDKLFDAYAAGADTASLQQLDTEIADWHSAWVDRARRESWRYRVRKPSHWFWRRMNRLDRIA